MQDFPYYTNREARGILGNISRQKLKQYVESGKLNRYIPPGEKQGLYLKTEVHALAQELDSFWHGKQLPDGKDIEDGRLRPVNSS